MLKKHCCYGLCTNDTRYPDREGMEGVFFINFPKPKTQMEKCQRWIEACGRPHSQFNVDKITKSTFICSKHFIGGNGPTDLHPDPVPAIAPSELLSPTSEQIQAFERGYHLIPDRVTRRKRLKIDHEFQAAAALMIGNSNATHGQEITLNDHPKMVEVAVQTDPVIVIPLNEAIIKEEPDD